MPSRLAVSCAAHDGRHSGGVGGPGETIGESAYGRRNLRRMDLRRNPFAGMDTLWTKAITLASVISHCSGG